MKQTVPLHISIPKPCTQNWEAMPATGNGRHCEACNNIVYDFSGMSDEEVLNFFKSRPETHCGRFHNAQLNRDISYSVKKGKLFTSRFNKIAAAVFTLLSFKSLNAPAAAKNITSAKVFDIKNADRNSAKPVKVTITGTIKERNGSPLEKVTIVFDTLQVALTDKEGRFSFEIDITAVTSHNLYFSYDGFITAVRNYHPAMAAANYDIELSKKGEGVYSMGIMLPPGEILGGLPSLLFKATEVKLTAGNKTILSELAIKLKNTPYARIIITAYPGGHIQQAVFTNRLNNIKKYLVENEGISADRIVTEDTGLGGDKNTVDIRSMY